MALNYSVCSSCTNLAHFMTSYCRKIMIPPFEGWKISEEDIKSLFLSRGSACFGDIKSGKKCNKCAICLDSFKLTDTVRYV